MKKRSLYATKRAHLQGGLKAARKGDNLAWLTALERSRPFDDQPLLPGIKEPTSVNSTAALGMVRLALDDLLKHRVPPSEVRVYGLLGHALDVAHIRAIQIQPDEDNPAHAPLIAAKAALHQVRQRRQRTGTWGLTGPERGTLAEAIDIYETILLSSSPRQMADAVDIRAKALRKGMVWSPLKVGETA